jgi:hypothetical protein
MRNFETSLLREKFTIQDLDKQGANAAIIVLSNRISLDLRDKDGNIQETLVIRGQNMHCCVRMASRIIKSFELAGPLMGRAKDYDWGADWKYLYNDYERKFNPDLWLTIYHKGRQIFVFGKHHPFVDLIEHCHEKSSGSYEKSEKIAEDKFRKTGKNIKIQYDGNIAMVINGETEKVLRCGVILRDANRKATFNFALSPPKDVDKDSARAKVNLSFCISACAAFLEGMQLAFLVGMNQEKMDRGIIDKRSDEAKKTREANLRMNRLRTEIANLEDKYAVRYRPEKPDFEQLKENSIALAQRTLDAEEQAS